MRRTPFLAILLIPALVTCGGGGDVSGPPPVQTPVALAIMQQPAATVAAGLGVSVVVAVKDAAGATVSASTASITLSIVTGSGASGATLLGSATVNAVNGVATFSEAAVDKVGSGYKLAASANGLTGATTSAFAVIPGAPARLVFVTQPPATTAGAVMAPAVQVGATDAYGNAVSTSGIPVTIGFTPGSSGALAGTLTQNMLSGIATFPDLVITQAAQTDGLVAAANGLASATSSVFSVTAGPAVSLNILQQPSSGISGAALTPSLLVQVRDSYDNPVRTSTAVTVTLAANTAPAGTTLGGTTTVTTTNGTAAFTSLTLDKAGAGARLTISATGLPPVTTNAISMAPGPFHHYALQSQPVDIDAAQPLPAIVVAAVDAQGNVVTSFDSAMAISIAPGTGRGGAHLLGALGVRADSGIATWTNLSVDSAGSGYALRISQISTGSITTATFDVRLGAPAFLRWKTVPAAFDAGVPSTSPVILEVLDAGGNHLTASTASVTLGLIPSLGAPGLTLSGPLTQSAVNGVVSFMGLVFSKASAVAGLQATWNGPSTNSPAFLVRSRPAVRAAFVVQPTATPSMARFSPDVTVALVDSTGTPDVQSTKTVTMALMPGTGTPGATLTGGGSTSVSQGLATFFILMIDKTGTGYRLIASSAGLAPDTSAPFDIVPGAPTHLVMVQQPSPVVSRVVMTPGVQVGVADGGGNIVTSANSPVTLSLPTGITLGGTRTVAASAGIATFADLDVDKAGTYQLAATAPGLVGVSSATFTVSPGAPATLFAITQPQSGYAGIALNALTIGIHDAGQNLVTNASPTVTASITSGTGTPGAVLSGTLSRQAVGGLVTFDDLSIDQAGNGYTLSFSVSGLPNLTTPAFNLSSALMTIQAFAGDGQTALAGAAPNVGPAVLVTSSGAPIAGVPVVFSVASGGGRLGGNPTIYTNAQGIAQTRGWNVGAAPGSNTLAATVPGGTFVAGANSVTFTATGIAGAFTIDVRNIGPAFSGSVQAAFSSAVQFWQSAIYGDIPDQPVSATGVCGTSVNLNETVDDVVILAQFDAIDGPGGILGQAGACLVRGNGLPVVGVMIFDTADVAGLINSGALNSVIRHEMGHVLGFSSGIWNLSPRHCANFLSTSDASGHVTSFDTHFACNHAGATTNALVAFDSLGGTNYTAGNKVPLENCAGAPPGCGPGTFNSHWREIVFGNELMTGYLDAGANPLSFLTLAAFEDEGYVVNYSAADAYIHTFHAPAAGERSRILDVRDDLLHLPLTVLDPTGRASRTVAPR